LGFAVEGKVRVRVRVTISEFRFKNFMLRNIVLGLGLCLELNRFPSIH
jgi:hypothetical protein